MICRPATASFHAVEFADGGNLVALHGDRSCRGRGPFHSDDVLGDVDGRWQRRLKSLGGGAVLYRLERLGLAERSAGNERCGERHGNSALEQASPRPEFLNDGGEDLRITGVAHRIAPAQTPTRNPCSVPLRLR